MRKNPLLILLNGPPRSGKDTAATYIAAKYDDYNPKIDRMSLPIKAAFFAMMYDETPEHDDNFYENSKESQIPIFSRKSPTSFRQWQIDFSEKFMKPYYGDEIFARLFLDRLLDTAPLVIVPDCGFSIEVYVLYNELPPDDILLIQLHRPGCDFTHDSREYVSAPAGNFTFMIDNDGNPEHLYRKLDIIVDPWLQARL